MVIGGFTVLRLIDLDFAITYGSSSNNHRLKLKNKNTLNVGGLNYLITTVCYGIKRNDVVIAMCLEPSCGPEEILSYRDWVTKLQYDIAVDRLKSMGVCVLQFKSRAELDDEMYKLAWSGKERFRSALVYTRANKVKECVLSDDSCTVLGEVITNARYYDSIEADVKFTLPGFYFYNLLGSLNVKNQNALYEKFERYVRNLDGNKRSIVKNADSPSVMKSFSKECYINMELERDEVQAIVNTVNKDFDNPETKDAYNWEDMCAYNLDALKWFLEVFRFNAMLKFFGWDYTNYQIDYRQRAYWTEMIGGYEDGSKQVNENIPVETEYGNDPEMIDTNYFESDIDDYL